MGAASLAGRLMAGWLLDRFFGARVSMLLGRTFDATGSYATLLPQLALFMFTVALLMLTLPRYEARRSARGVPAST